MADCASTVDNMQRLACFDRLAAPRETTVPDRSSSANVPAQSRSVAATTVSGSARASSEPSTLQQHWELGEDSKRETFAFRSHRDNYVMFAKYSTAPNSAPYEPFRKQAFDGATFSHAELAFQLGFKMKLLEDVSPLKTNLWFGYTQQSYWQAFNGKISSAFRETNYQPELMAVVPLNFELLGMKARFLNFGLTHQSNGQASTLSRSWNRVYLQAGLERDNFILQARVWKRLSENGTDDNPDIIDYMGHGDISATYQIKGHELSVLARHNFSTNRGGTQLGWAFPLANQLKGYVQVFSGYGQSLIDYNHSQTTIGAGVKLHY